MVHLDPLDLAQSDEATCCTSVGDSDLAALAIGFCGEDCVYCVG